MTYSVTLETYKGPLDLLLELITQEKLEINEISLAQVTKQYLLYIEENNLPARELADFLSIAAKLLHIKTKALLPYLYETSEEDDVTLEQQLKIYKVYWEASKKIDALFAGEFRLFSKTKTMFNDEIIFSPPSKKQITPQLLKTVFFTIINGLEEVVNLPKTIIRKTVSLVQKIASLREKLQNISKLHFKRFVYSAENKTDLIVNFLAVLEMIKQCEIDIDADEKGEIFLRKI